MCLVANEYDDKLSLISATNKKYRIDIPVFIEPEDLHIFDIQSELIEDSEQMSKHFAIAIFQSDKYMYQNIHWSHEAKKLQNPYAQIIEKLTKDQC